MTEAIGLHFHGPLTFTPGERSLFHSPYRDAPCVYLWTIRSNLDGLHYIRYVGEASCFAARQRDHLIHMLGMNYGIFDPDAARKREQKMLWPGLWRDRSVDGPARLLKNYLSLAEQALRHVEAQTVFVAELHADRKLRAHIEGTIAWNLRKNHPEMCALYPPDNRTVRGQQIGAQLRIVADAAIAGIDPILEI